MTGAYAQEWPGRGPWAQQGRGGRGYGEERERYGDERGHHGEGRCGGPRGGKGRHGRPSDRTVGRTLGTAAQDGTQGRGRRPSGHRQRAWDPGNSDAANLLLTHH